jgi:RNA polymerase sigma-70 factor, ECF subfamily
VPTVLEGRSPASLAMDAYADGDESAFSVIYDELAPRLYAYVRGMTRADAAAQDIVQQTFMNMHHARSRFSKGGSVEAWMYAIARRLTIDWTRAERKRWEPAAVEELAGALRGPELEAADAQLRLALVSELKTVPEKLREAFLLVRVQGFSAAEAAEVLGTSAMAVKLRAHRAGVLLRPAMAKFGSSGGSR